MSDDSLFATLMADFGSALGIADLVPTADGVCQLMIDGRHMVNIVDASERDLVFLSCRLADHGIDDAQAVRMARANFLQAGRGVVLCVGPDGRPYMQLALERAACQAETLVAELEGLLDQVEAWTRGGDTQDVSPKQGRGDADPAMLVQSV
ncbi:type III secretion system chaperone [Alcaligenes sp. WGS1538]|uniref:type III secretion system chaperone n=1 Tax=Alcaligenes sp. WGS1538 TaxID=3366811 RepID=UPI00372D1E23